MYRKMTFAVLVVLLVTLLAALPVFAEETIRTREWQALANFATESTCLRTEIFILAREGEVRQTDQPDLEVRGVIINIREIDLCDGGFEFVYLADIPLTSDEFQINPGLNFAQLDTTATVCDADFGSFCHDVDINLSWQAVGQGTNSREPLQPDGYLQAKHQPAALSGTVLLNGDTVFDDTTEYFAEMVSIRTVLHLN